MWIDMMLMGKQGLKQTIIALFFPFNSKAMVSPAICFDSCCKLPCQQFYVWDVQSVKQCWTSTAEISKNTKDK